MLQTSDSDEILTDYRNDYLYAYNNKGEIVDKVKRVAGWNEIGNDWYYVSSEMNFVDGIYTVNGKEYYFENGRLIKSSNVEPLSPLEFHVAIDFLLLKL